MIFLFGPRPDFPSYTGRIGPISWPLEALDSIIQAREAAVPGLKPDNQARIIWADSARRTPYSVVYLHGFSASPMEGNPVHLEFAARYGCNLYLARLPQHGINDPESFKNVTPKDWVEAAKEALAIGQQLGEKVILMSCSTGSTLSIYLAAENPDAVEAQIMYSPNIAIADPAAGVLTYPWGLQAARLLVGEYRTIPSFMGWEAEQYWTVKYRTEGLVALQALLEETMRKEEFEKVKQPFFLGYYFKNEKQKDEVVSIEAMHRFFEQASTPPRSKQMIAFPDVDTHVIPSRLFSKGLEEVQAATYRFAEEVLGLRVRVE
ncbi:MAG: alpha/beta hydrolase [Phaeodactylibacter sp.]|nr:alpha/beta hydrolase [Phaeodactylibacter sp.]MCB9288463.1 alpha/beta hydrolase [Lewinellaceae bacterium]